MLVAGLIYINIAFFPDPLKNGTNFPKQLLKLPTQRPSSLPWGPRPGPIEHLNFFYFYITSTNSLHCFLAHIARAQHISAEDGLFCPLQIRHLDLDLACSRLPDSGENGSKKSAKNRVRTGERECGGACKHCFKYLIPIYQLLVYPLIGLFLTVYFNTYVIHLVSLTLNKHREQISCAWFQWIEFSIIVPKISQILVRVIWAKSGLRNLTRRKDVFAMLPTGFGKSIIFQLFPCVVTCPYIWKTLRSCEGMSSKIVVLPFFSIMRDHVEQLKRPGFSASTKGIGKESDQNKEKLFSLFAKSFSEALRAGFPNYGWRNSKRENWASKRLQWL